MSRIGESTRRAISAETIKIPEPIMDPMTSVVALSGPRPFTNPASLEVTEVVWGSVAKTCFLVLGSAALQRRVAKHNAMEAPGFSPAKHTSRESYAAG